jgi:hypothetical protein
MRTVGQTSTPREKKALIRICAPFQPLPTFDQTIDSSSLVVLGILSQFVSRCPHNVIHRLSLSYAKRELSTFAHLHSFLRGENTGLAALSGTKDFMQSNHRAGEVGCITVSHA